MRIKPVITILIGVLALPLMGGCLFSPPEKPPPEEEPVVYLPYTSRANLIENFVRAWEARDAAEYRDNILYNGDQASEGGLPATDGQYYRTFIFYYADGEDIWGNQLPTEQTYEEEVANVSRLFSGNPGQGPNGEYVPGVESIDLELTLNQTWVNPSNPDDVEGDPYPEGVKRAIYTSDMLLTLKDTFQEDTTGFTVLDDLEFHVIPVLVDAGSEDEHTEYRIWKWRDLHQGNP